MNSLIQNYINGNLSTARKQARRFSAEKITLAFRDAGYTYEKAKATAYYLKTGRCYQYACDTK